jgi:hypothetical protein
MATLDPIPASFQSDGLWTVTYVPTGSNPLSAAILNGSSAKDITYGLTADGFTYAVTQAEVPDPRLTLVQSLTRPGKTTETLSIKYPDSIDANSPAVLFAPDSTTGAYLSGFLVVRRGVQNGTAYAVGQKVDVITFQLGVQAPDAPAENGIDTITQGVYITSATQRKATVVA